MQRTIAQPQVRKVNENPNVSNTNDQMSHFLRDISPYVRHLRIIFMPGRDANGRILSNNVTQGSDDELRAVLHLEISVAEHAH